MRNLVARLAPQPPRLRAPVRDETQQWRQWYKTFRWQKLRWSILVRDSFTCNECKRTEPDTALLVCDHITPHGGSVRAFWAGPFQTLCKSCHDAKTNAERDRGGR